MSGSDSSYTRHSGNTIDMESVLSIQVTGKGNSLFYANTQAPTISVLGAANTIKRGKSEIGGGNSVSSTRDRQTLVDEGGKVVVSNNNGTTEVGGAAGAAASAALQAGKAASEAAAAVAGQVNGIQDNGSVVNLIISDKRITRDCATEKPST